MEQAALQAAPREKIVPGTSKTQKQIDSDLLRKANQAIWDKYNKWTQGETQSEKRERELRQNRESGRDVVVVRANA